MSAMTIGRGVACWLGLALSAAALYGQETTGDEPKPEESQNLNAATDKDVARLKAELEARRVELQKMQAEMAKAEMAREMLAAEMQRLRQSLEVAARERKSVEENLKRQADEMTARMRAMMSGQPGKDASPADQFGRADDPTSPKDRPFQERLESARKAVEEAARATAAEAMQRAAEGLSHAARQADAAASRLDEAKRTPDRERPHDIDQGWQKLLERANTMLTQSRQSAAQSRRSEEAAAKFLPKLESAATQLRKVGRNEEADQLLAEAKTLLAQGNAAPSRPRDEVRPDVTPREHRSRDESRGRVDVERAVDELRREVEQLRREVRDLRQSLQRTPGGNESSHQESKRRYPTDERRAVSELVSVETHLRGEVVRLGEEGRPIRVGEEVKKGDTLAVLWNERLVELTAGIPNHPDAKIIGQFSLEAPASGTVVEKKVSLGEVVSPGDVLFQIEVHHPDTDETTRVRDY